MLITRIAPTPSGYLHAGNLANFLIVAGLAQGHEGTLALRIDDMDTPRIRQTYVDNVFNALEWLGITWQRGPQNADEFSRDFTMSRRTEHYRQHLESMESRGLPTFVCTCSRSQLGPGATCVSGCRDVRFDFTPGSSSIRLAVPDLTIMIDGMDINLRASHGDAVLWRRDDRPSYHLANIVEDAELGTTDIVRGADLRDSSALHLWMTRYLPATASIRYFHHDLVSDMAGAKLSKSTGTGAPMEFTNERRTQVVRLATRLALPLGITPWQ